MSQTFASLSKAALYFTALVRKAYDGDLAIFGTSSLEGEGAGQLRAAQIAIVFRYTPWMMLATAFNVAILIVTLQSGPQFHAALCWGGAIFMGVLVTLWGWWRNRSRAMPSMISSRAIHSAVQKATVLGAIWGLLPILLFRDASDLGRLVIICLCSGMLGGGAFALATIPVAALCFTGMIFIGVTVALASIGDWLYLPLFLLLLSYTSIIVRVAISHARLFAEHMLARIEGQTQLDLIGLLLCDFEENASDWLWETDAANCLRHVSPRLATLLARPAAELAGLDALEVLVPGSRECGKTGVQAGLILAEKLQTRQSFRDLVVPVKLHDGPHWWSLTAKVIFDGEGRFCGFRGFGSDVTQARDIQTRMVELARIDALTGLPNRVAFGEAMNAAVSRLSRYGERFAVLCLDIDHFKTVNDTMGHHAGDELLSAVARRLSASIRPMDVAARIGGDEFTIIVARTDEITDFAQKIVKTLSQPFEIDGKPLEIGASIGIALAPSDGMDGDTLMKNADLALYRAKAEGRGRFCFFEANMDSDARARRLLERDLRGAMARNEFRLLFQPVIDLSSKKVCAFEALLRWHCPERGIVAPMEFISVLEETGLIQSVGEWVLRKSCEEALAWPAEVRVAVNVSAVQFRHGGIIAAVHNALELSGIQPDRLELEITESVFLNDMGTTQDVLKVLRQLGVRIALDDFGTGFSSLSYLRRLSFDKIKLDKSFIDDIAINNQSASIVRALIELAGELGVDITAEGVETQDQLDSLNDKGCGTAQGFLFSRPVEGNKVASVLKHLSRKLTVAA